MTTTLITPTGKRHKSFALCERWMDEQVGLDPERPIQWIVVDDCPEEPTKCKLGQLYIQGPLKWEPGINTQRYNMDEALKHVKGDVIFIIEDDDYYAPTYIYEILKLLESCAIAGLSNSPYYHLQIPGWKEMGNYEHSSLSSTAFTRELLPQFRKAVHSGSYYFDIELWNTVKAEHIPAALISNTNLSIGMKGVPGRNGLGAGHPRKDYFLDKDQSKLKSWLGEDAKYYQPFIETKGLDETLKKPSFREQYRQGMGR